MRVVQPLLLNDAVLRRSRRVGFCERGRKRFPRGRENGIIDSKEKNGLNFKPGGLPAVSIRPGYRDRSKFPYLLAREHFRDHSIERVQLYFDIV